MVKQITKVETAKSKNAVEEIFPGGVLQLDFSDKVKLAEKCGHEGCLKFQHCVECECSRCERDFKDKDKKTCEFIRKSRGKHGDKYGYYKTIYTRGRDKVIITCPEHGDFPQTANDHAIYKCGCKKCGTKSMVKKQSGNIHDFILRSNIIHDYKYDYSKSVYINAFTKLSIVCKIHGIFKMTPHDHLHKRGCKKCGRIIATEKSKDTK